MVYFHSKQRKVSKFDTTKRDKWKEKVEEARCVNTTPIEKREIATELQKDSFSVS